MLVRKELKALFVLALPLILAQIAQTSMSFIDTLMVGRLGSDALAAIALGATIFMFVSLLLMGSLFSVGPMVSQAHGANKPREAARATRQGLWLGTGMSVPAIILFWNIEPLLIGMGQDAVVAQQSAAYLRAISFGILPSLWVTAFRGLLEGIAVTRPIMLITFIGVGLNITFNYVLIFGKFGFPALGLVGSGYASLIVYFSMFIMTAVYVSKRYGHYRIFADLRVPDVSVLKELIRVGVPIGLTLGFEASLFSVSALLMGVLGKTELAAHQIAVQTASMTFMVPLGLSIATSIRVGQAKGRGDSAAVRRAGYQGITMSTLTMLFSASFFLLAPRFIIGLYIDITDPANADVIRYAILFLSMAAMFQLADGLQVSASGALRGLKDTKVPMVISFIAYWLVGMSSGVYLTFVANVGGRGLWIGLVVGLSTAAALLIWRFVRLTNRQALAAGVMVK